MAFYAVYILEAHPTDIWTMQSNVKDNVLFASPKNDQERENVANACVRKLGIKFPAIVDGFDNTTEKAYTGWPDRLYLISSDGKVLYKSKPGPFGFKPDQLEGAIKKLPEVRAGFTNVVSVSSEQGANIGFFGLQGTAYQSIMGW